MSNTVNLDIPATAEERIAADMARIERPAQIEALILGMARILRARLKEEIFDPSGNNRADYEAMCELLAPFDPSPDEPVNDASTADTQR